MSTLTNLDRGELWSWCRSLLSQGVDIHMDNSTSHAAYSARLDVAARERADELAAAITADTAATRDAERIKEAYQWLSELSRAADNDLAKRAIETLIALIGTTLGTGIKSPPAVAATGAPAQAGVMEASNAALEEAAKVADYRALNSTAARFIVKEIRALLTPPQAQETKK